MKRKKLLNTKIKCNSCKKEFAYTGKTGDIQFRPYPYMVEIEGDNTKFWLCDDCCNRNAEEI